MHDAANGHGPPQCISPPRDGTHEGHYEGHQAYDDPTLCRALLKRLEATLDGRRLRFMEVCGTHTVAMFRSGLRSLLPANVTHLSGPGCPVCVTHDAEVAAFLELAQRRDHSIATFGDLMRVPGPNGHCLKHAVANGARVELIYSPLDALTLATDNPSRTVILLGVGFETTAPTIAATILTARNRGIDNFCVFSMHKLVPPALHALLTSKASAATVNGMPVGPPAVDAFLLPGHVATVLGLEPFAFLAHEHQMPAVVGGFEPADILLALCRMAEQMRDNTFKVENAYPRAVNDAGNARARERMYQVFEPADALWRGLGRIPQSGLRLRPEYADMDACARLGLTLTEEVMPTGCRCGLVLTGHITPPDCPLFGKTCTPAAPIGPCMVSTEGSCAAYFKYSLEPW